MLSSFSTALGSALTSFVTSLTTAVSDNLTIVLPLALGLIGIFVLWRIVSKMVKAR